MAGLLSEINTATMPSPTPSEVEGTGQVNREPVTDKGTNNSFGSLPARTSLPDDQPKPDATTQTIRSKGEHSLVNQRLFHAWVQAIVRILEGWGQDSAGQAIAVSENYLLGLKSSANHRIFISTLVNAVRFNEINSDSANKILATLRSAKNRDITKEQALEFMRQMRVLGFFSSGM